MTAPEFDTPGEFLALTRAMLVPSILRARHGRTVTEAMVNGVPTLVGNRGGLPRLIQSGEVATPDAHCGTTTRPVGARATTRALARTCFDEDANRRHIIEYVESLAHTRRPGLG